MNEQCPVCGGEGRVYRRTPAYEAMVAAATGWTFRGSARRNWWRECNPCGGSGLISAPLAEADREAEEDRALGAAWRRAEAALPEGWTFHGVRPLAGQWWAMAMAPALAGGIACDQGELHHQPPEHIGVYGATPTAALLALIERLEARRG